METASTFLLRPVHFNDREPLNPTQISCRSIVLGVEGIFILVFKFLGVPSSAGALPAGPRRRFRPTRASVVRLPGQPGYT